MKLVKPFQLLKSLYTNAALYFLSALFRVRVQAGARQKVAAKRSYANYLLPYKSMNWSKPRTSLINMSAFPGQAAEAETPGEREEQQSKLTDVFEFRRGVIPPYRQMFYQYCDIKVTVPVLNINNNSC